MNRKSFIYIILIVAAIVVGAFIYISRPRTIASANTVSPSSPTQTLNKNFTIAKKIIYTLDTASLENEILINGQKVKTVPGKTFLILNIKLTNPTNTGVQMNTRDYVRLSVGDSSEWMAPDIHNDPVEVQALSTKTSRLGFPVADNIHDFTLHIGELSGSKTDLPLHF